MQMSRLASSGRPRILQVLYSFRVGGSEIFGLQLARQLIQPSKFFIFLKRTGKRFERWAARRRQAWPFTNIYKHIR